MGTDIYFANYADKWEKEDFQARIYEILLESYEQNLDDLLATGNYTNEEEAICLENEKDLPETGYLDDSLIDEIIEGKEDLEENYD